LVTLRRIRSNHRPHDAFAPHGELRPRRLPARDGPALCPLSRRLSSGCPEPAGFESHRAVLTERGDDDLDFSSNANEISFLLPRDLRDRGERIWGIRGRSGSPPIRLPGPPLARLDTELIDPHVPAPAFQSRTNRGEVRFFPASLKNLDATSCRDSGTSGRTTGYGPY